MRIERLAEAAQLVKRYFSGERFSLQGLGITCDLDAAAAKAAKFYSLSVAQLRDSPHFVFGDEAAAIDKLQRMREESGVTRLNLSGYMVDEAAPLIRELG